MDLFASSTVCLPLPWMEVGEGLTCIFRIVSLSTVGGSGGGSYFHHPQCVSLYLGYRWGDGHLDYLLGDCWRSKWLICIMHIRSPSTGHWGGGGDLTFTAMSLLYKTK